EDTLLSILQEAEKLRNALDDMRESVLQDVFVVSESAARAIGLAAPPAAEQKHEDAKDSQAPLPDSPVKLAYYARLLQCYSTPPTDFSAKIAAIQDSADQLDSKLEINPWAPVFTAEKRFFTAMMEWLSATFIGRCCCARKRERPWHENAY